MAHIPKKKFIQLLLKGLQNDNDRHILFYGAGHYLDGHECFILNRATQHLNGSELSIDALRPCLFFRAND